QSRAAKGLVVAILLYDIAAAAILPFCWHRLWIARYSLVAGSSSPLGDGHLVYRVSAWRVCANLPVFGPQSDRFEWEVSRRQFCSDEKFSQINPDVRPC